MSFVFTFGKYIHTLSLILLTVFLAKNINPNTWGKVQFHVTKSLTFLSFFADTKYFETIHSHSTWSNMGCVFHSVLFFGHFKYCNVSWCVGFGYIFSINKIKAKNIKNENFFFIRLIHWPVNFVLPYNTRYGIYTIKA